MSSTRRWQTVPPRGRVVTDPVVIRLAAGPDPGIVPRRRLEGTRGYVTYSRTRVYLDRAAWEMLGDDDVLVMRVRPAGEAHWTLALTKQELERVFGQVKDTRSWDEARCYHFPVTPPAAAAFLVRP